jgi:peptide deformylase
MILDIVKYGQDPYNHLRRKCEDVQKTNPFLQQLIKDMFETAEYNGGIGLAAPQIGRNLNLFIVNLPDFKEVFINPQILPVGLEIETKEGCLSFPSITFPVLRRQNVKVKYYDKNWAHRIMEFYELQSIVIQHEYDHLSDKLIID